MKKVLVIGAVVALAIAVFGVAGFAYAQTQTPPNPDAPFYGPGMMQRGGGFGGGMMGRWGQGGYGPMHTYMVDAFAEALGVEPADLQAELDSGETMYTIAQAKGISDEDFANLWVEARTKALEASVADGVITQAQADWMLERMQWRQENGFGPGNCPMHDGSFGPGRGPARWNNQ